MSGKVTEIGYRGQAGHRASRCKGCHQRIEWGVMFGKRHPFNADGTSHFDTCPEADQFRGGLRTIGDRDTFYRCRWREQNYEDDRHFDRSVLRSGEVPPSVASRLAQALCRIGGPLQSAGWSVAHVQQCFHRAGLDAHGNVIAVEADNLIRFRLRDYFNDAEFRPYLIKGVFIT